jgi:cysteine-rich repeat protein
MNETGRRISSSRGLLALAGVIACGGDPDEAVGGGDVDGSGDASAPGCGNGEPDEGEICDDGNANNVDGCTNDCELGPVAITLSGTAAVGTVGDATVGIEYPDDCPAGQVVRGVSGEVSALGTIANLRIVCAVVGLVDALPVAVNLQIGDSLPVRGTPGPTPFSRDCEAAALVGLAARADGGLQQVTVSCAPMELVETAGGWDIELADAAALAPAGADTPAPVQALSCPPHQVATGLSLVAADTLQAFTLRCSDPGAS